MIRISLLLVAIGMLAACESAPTAPHVIDAPQVAAVATTQPGVWDSADELAAWVTNGITTGAVSVVGDGTDAVIQIDVTKGPTALHGPNLDPPALDVQGVRVRYRWIGRESGDSASLFMYLRPPEELVATTVQRLSPPIGRDLSDLNSGAWLEKTWTSGNTPAPYKMLYAIINIGSPGTAATMHGTFEIDWIALVR